MIPIRSIGIAVLLFFSNSSTLYGQQQITLLFAGDLMQHKEQINAARTADGTYDYTPCFADVCSRIGNADLAIANLETTFAHTPYTGYPAFNSPDEYLYAIRDAGFDVLLTANNHCLDRRQKGLERTIRLLDSLHIPHTGTYRTAEERSKRYPLFLLKKGFRIALLNYTYGTNGIRPTPPNRVNYIDKDSILQDINIARAWQPDVIIACMHWGNEYQSLPNAEQRQLADWLLQRGVTHVIGSHPHVIQPIEIRTDSLGGSKHAIVYSLGNFISNMSRANTDGGLIFTMTLEKNTVDRIIPRTYLKQCSYSLVWTARPALTQEQNYRLCPIDSLSIARLPSNARQRLNIFVNHARRLLNKYNIGDVREE